MPYLFSDEQRQIREEVRRVLLAAGALPRLRALLDSRGEYDDGYWRTAREMGWSAMAIAEAQGGLGLTIFDALIVAEECGRAVVGAPFLATGFAAAYALAEAAALPERLQALASGESIVTLAFSEGSEILPSTPAARFADGRLSGEKTALLGGAVADAAIVLASENGVPCLLAVDLGGEGVSRDTLQTIDNSRCVATVRFASAPAIKLPVDDALGLARATLGRLALFLASEGVGGGDACIALAVDYANQRQAFGQAIGKFQAVKHAIAEMYVLNEMARASVLDAAVRLEAGDADAEAYLGAARLNAVQAYEYASATATYIHGGTGVTWEADLHLHYRRSRSLAVEAGGAAYWEDRIVRILEAA